MPKDNENIRLPFVGPLSPSEPQGFAADAMIRCEECLRANPPTRVSCLYCAAPLPQTEASARLRKPTLRPPEKHQPGYNNIIVPSETKATALESIAGIASLLKLDSDVLTKIIKSERPLPVARTASRDESELVVERLSELGLRTVTVSDSDLGLSDSCVNRVRVMRLDDHGIAMQQSSSATAVESTWSNVLLLVSGRLREKTVEVNERKTRKSENEIVRSSQFFSDETVIDIYLSTDPHTWRVCASGFDFSCLGSEKALLASENIARLLKLIAQKATLARVDESYAALRQTLEPIWTTEQETQSMGWRREGTGKYSLGASTVNSNEKQFTLYSRLNYYFASQRSS